MSTVAFSHLIAPERLATEVLVRRQDDHPTHVFTYEGNPITQVNTKAWRNALKRAGIGISGGMTFDTRLQHGTGKREPRRMNCNALEAGKRSPWSSAMLTWPRKAFNWQPLDWT